MSQWGDKPTPDNVPNYLTEEQKAQAKATERGWEIPLAGTNPDKGLMEVIVAIGGLVDNVDSADGEVALTFDIFDMDAWEEPVIAADPSLGIFIKSAPAVFETTTFKRNKVLHIQSLAADYDVAHPLPTDYRWQREVMTMNLPGDGEVEVTADNSVSVSGKIYINKDWKVAGTYGQIAIFAPIFSADDSLIHGNMFGVAINDGALQMWGPTPLSLVEDPSLDGLPENKYATFEYKVSVGKIDYILNGNHVATQTVPAIVPGHRIKFVGTHNFNSGADMDYYVDDIAVIAE